MIHDSILDTIGRTPLVRLRRVAQRLDGQVVAKLETTGPTGSSMDRVALALVEKAEADGLLLPGATLIEAASGNLGIALAAVAATRGYRLLFVTDDRQSQEKIDALKAFGAEAVVCPTSVRPEDPRSKQSVAQRLSEETPNACYLRYYDTADAAEAHAASTGPELWQQTGGKITHLFCGLASGAMASGTGRHLKTQNPAIRVIGVDPCGSVLHEFWKTRRLSIEGEGIYRTEEIGAESPSRGLDPDVIDEVIQVDDRDGMRMARTLARREALLTGGAGGTVVAGCLAWCEEHGLPDDALAVCVLPDDGFRYLSKVFNDVWMQENRFLEDRLEVTAADIVERKTGGEPLPRLVSVGPHSLVLEVVELLKQYGISQIPVLDGGKVIGSVREGRIVHLLLTDPNAKSHTVQDVLDDPFPTVEPTARITEISNLLEGKSPAVLVPYGDGWDILTKADLIRAIAR